MCVLVFIVQIDVSNLNEGEVKNWLRMISILSEMHAVKALNKGHFGDGPFVLCRKVVPLLHKHKQAHSWGGGVEGVCLNLVLTSRRFYMHRLTVHFKCPNARNWSTSFAAILRITAV